MAFFDFLSGSAKKRDQTKSGPGNAGGGNERARAERLKQIADAKKANSDVSSKLDADAKAKAAAEKSADKKKKAAAFWSNVLGKDK